MAYTEDNRLKNYQRQNNITDGDDDETAHQVSYTYDPLGRRSSKSQRGHEGVRTQEYQYDGMGLDLIRIADAASLVTTPDAGTDLLKKDTVEDSRAKFIKPQRHEQYETNGLDVLYANGRIFSSLSRDKGLTIYTTDSLGSVRYTSNNHDASKHSYNYDAFGESMGAPPDLFGYNGRVYDRVTTNYDYGFRDYAAKQGRFTTVDPIQDGSNWYAYVNNDPVNFTDPDGLLGSTLADRTDGPAPNAPRVEQTSLPPPGPTDACYFRALQANAETYTNKNLTRDQVMQAAKDLIKSGAMTADYTVNDQEAVVNDALRRLGDDSSTAQVAKPGDEDFDEVKDGATGSIRLVGRRDTGQAGHYQEGDANGDYVWDPKDGDKGRDRKLFDKQTQYVKISCRKG